MEAKDLLLVVTLYVQCYCLAYAATQPPTGVCKDKKTWCPYYKCSSAFVRRFCPKQCGLCATVRPTLSLPQCGKVKVRRQKLITSRRTKSTPGQYPWQVALFYNKQFFCGGTLISKTHILTGAQCLAWFGNDITNLKVVLGEYDISTTEGTEKTIAVKRRILHPGYNIRKRDHDIAILELAREAALSNHVQPICLPKVKEEIKKGTRCVMTGWGRKYPEWRFANTLEQSGAPIVDTGACRRRNRLENITITDNMICTGYDDGKNRVSSCHGDSGGPIACKTRDGVWKQYGVISWGSMTCNGAERYTVNTKVSAYRGWINKTIK